MFFNHQYMFHIKASHRIRIAGPSHTTRAHPTALQTYRNLIKFITHFTPLKLSILIKNPRNKMQWNFINRLSSTGSFRYITLLSSLPRRLSTP